MVLFGMAGVASCVLVCLGGVRLGRRGIASCVTFRYNTVWQVGYVSLWHVLFLWGKLRQVS